MTINLESYPSPDVIETVAFEQILAEMQDELTRLFPAIAPTLALESALANKLLQVASFREMLFRARVNDAARANLLAFANNADLDHLAAFYDVVRLEGEDDEALRSRTILAIQARSPAGGVNWYKAAARRADVRIRDIAVYREEILPIVHVAVLSRENDGIPDQEMLNAVREIVTSDEVRPLNDTVIVEAAVQNRTDVEANVWLLPSSPLADMAPLQDALRIAWETETGIGFDLVPSWIEARLHVSGVQRVEMVNPVSPLIAEPGTAIAIGEIKLNYMGRDY